MKLFKVTCHSGGAHDRTLSVFVVAKNHKEAGDKAISKLKKAEYVSSSYAGNIEYLASEGLYEGEILCL